MKQAKNIYYNHKLLNILMAENTITIEQMAKEVGLSEKTVRQKISYLNDYLTENNLGQIEKKQRVGIWLSANENQRADLKVLLAGSKPMHFHQDEQERIKEAIRFLLKKPSHEVITTMNLADNLYLSIPTTSAVLKECKDWFAKYKIELQLIRNKGIQLKCREYDFRLATLHFILKTGNETFEATLKDFVPGLDIQKIKNIILQTENAWRLEFAESSFRVILVLLCLSVARKEKSYPWSKISGEIESIQDYNEYAFAESLYKKVEREYHLTRNQPEVELLAVQILGAKLFKGDIFIGTDYVEEYDKTINRFVKSIIETVGAILNLDLSDDEILFESLLLHIRPTLFRLRYGNLQMESLSSYIKNEYRQAFRATWATSHLFEEYYGLQVTEDELVYLTLYLQSAIERRQQSLNSLLVTGMGMGQSQLLCERLKREIPEMKDIKVVSEHEFKERQWSQTDLIICTSKLADKDGRMILIDGTTKGEGFQPLKNKVREINQKKQIENFHFDSICHQMFEPELIFVHPEMNDKEAVLTFMAGKLKDKGYVTEHYLQSVFDREKATTTSIGERVAIPHGNMMEVNESKIAIAVLEKPILWHGDLVDIIFLLAVRMTTPAEIKKTQQFYKQFIFLDEKLEMIRNMKSNLELYQFFIR